MDPEEYNPSLHLEQETHRIGFEDFNGIRCSLQSSSIVNAECLWLGINDASPLVMARDAARLGVKTKKVNGWVPYPVPDEVLFHTRMHLTRKQVAELLPLLIRFVLTGRVRLCKKDLVENKPRKRPARVLAGLTPDEVSTLDHALFLASSWEDSVVDCQVNSSDPSDVETVTRARESRTRIEELRKKFGMSSTVSRLKSIRDSVAEKGSA